LTGLDAVHPVVTRIPSRDANPFATCWTKPGAIAYRCPGGESLATIAERLEQNGWWGQILGPHGSGKSTLLASLREQIAGRRNVRNLQVRDYRLQRFRNWSWSDLAHGDVLMIDGYDQLGGWTRWRIAAHARRRRCGLVVTTHRRLALSMLARTAPELPLVQRLVDELTVGIPGVVAPGDVAASFARHNGNVREIFFDLYDRYERYARDVVNY
jgi:hypothetical protein